MKIKILSLEKETRNIQVDNEKRQTHVNIFVMFVNDFSLAQAYKFMIFQKSNQNKLAQECFLKYIMK